MMRFQFKLYEVEFKIMKTELKLNLTELYLPEKLKLYMKSQIKGLWLTCLVSEHTVAHSKVQ